MARPRLPADQRRDITQSIRLREESFNVIYKVAQVQGVSVHRLLSETIERVFLHETIRGRYEACYGALQAIPSTLTGLVSGSSPRSDVQPPD